MSDPKYNRLPHAGDFESVNGTEAFYLAPKPLPTGSAAFSGQGMHHDINDAYLDFAPGKTNFEFFVRLAFGSNIFFVMFFFLVSVLAAWVRRHKENFFEGWLEFFSMWPVWVLIGCHALLYIYYLLKAVRQITTQPPIRFNRQRREVAYVSKKGEPPLIVPWEEVIACVTVSNVITEYAVMPSASLIIGLRDSSSGEVVRLTIATGHLSLAVSEWEALRVYMEEGPLALPTPLLMDEEFQEGTVAHFHMCRELYREMHSWPVYAFGFLTIQFCSGWTLPCRFSEWINTRPKAAFPPSIREWSKPLPAEQHAQPSAELVQQSAELRLALGQGQSLLDYYKVKFAEPEPAQ